MAILETTEDLDAIAANFLAVMPSERHEKTKKALAVLLPAYSSGTIFNADFQAYKSLVDRSFEDAFRDLRDHSFKTYWNPDGKTVSPQGEINNAMGFASGVRSSISMTKKAAKIKIQDPHLDAIKAFLAACVPLANIFEKLKTMVVKGKKPLSPEKAAVKAAQLAAKDLKTCACCFRSIAVIGNGLIADHGYTLPHAYGKTSSCPGRQFRPLEVSDDGLKHMIHLFTSQIESLEKALADLPSRTTLFFKSHDIKKSETIGKDDPRWEKTYKRFQSEREADLKYISARLKLFQTTLTNWKPAIVESIRGLTAQLREEVQDN